MDQQKDPPAAEFMPSRSLRLSSGPSRHLVRVPVMVVMLTFACSPTSGEPPLEAMLTDGKRLDGNRVESWHEPGLLTLDGQRLTEAGNHYRWIRNRTLSTVYHSGTRLELIGGDVIPGRALEYVDDDGGRPAHVVVHPLAGPQPAPNPPSVVRVDARYVRRVVWRDGDPDHTDAEAATAILLDGRVLKFTFSKLP